MPLPQAHSRKAVPEEILHRAVALSLAWRLREPVWWNHVPNGEKRSKAAAGRLKAMGVKAGVWDLYVAWPGGTGWIELKSKRGTLSPDQIVFGYRMEALGHKTAVCRSEEEVVAALEAWGVPMLRMRRAA